MSDTILDRKYRPKNLSEMVGQEALLTELSNQFASGRVPRAIMLTGESGSGKTTLAKILAMLLQFGDFNKQLTAEDWEMWHVFDILEQNAADVNGVEAMRELIQTTRVMPRHPSKYKVFILNEAHKLTPAAQEALLCPTEDADMVIWILTTTDPGAFKVTLKRRFSQYKLAPLTVEQMAKLLGRIATWEAIQTNCVQLAELLSSAGITSPSRGVMALEKVAAGVSMEAAIDAAVGELNSRDLCRDLLKGEWTNLGKALGTYTSDEVASLRYMLLGYLKRVVISGGNRATQAAKMITLLTENAPSETPALVPWITARLFEAVSLGSK